MADVTRTLVIDTSYGSAVGIVGREPIIEADSRTHVERLQGNIARAVAEGVRLICAFFIALEGGGELAEADFSKNFLTGAEEGVPLVRPQASKKRPRKRAKGG